MHVPLITQDIALQLEQAKANYVDSWVRGMQEQKEAHFEAAVFRAKNVRAFAARDMPAIGLFNQVIGLGPHNGDLLPEILHFYRDQGIEHYRIEVNPYHVSSDFLATLASHGCALSRFETYVCGVAGNTPDPPATIPIREVTPGDMDMFCDTHVQGYQEALAQVPEPMRARYRESLHVLSQRQGWHLYLAWADDIPIGMGMLYLQDGVASLAGGATLPAQRQQGVQTALLLHGLRVVAQAQCPLVVAQTLVGSTSQHNVERQGMRTAYTAAVMTRHRS